MEDPLGFGLAPDGAPGRLPHPNPRPRWRNWQTRQLEGLVPFIGSAGSTPVLGTMRRRSRREPIPPFSFQSSRACPNRGWQPHRTVTGASLSEASGSHAFFLREDKAPVRWALLVLECRGEAKPSAIRVPTRHRWHGEVARERWERRVNAPTCTATMSAKQAAERGSLTVCDTLC